jgi:beta-glucosidase/6-phospho-beta-glucosidase/beta-galactosidase
MVGSLRLVMAKLGVNSYRFSISWPRVVPLGGRDDPINEQGLQFYSDLVDELLKHNIIPFVVSPACSRTSSCAPAASC